jgi:hypothetical protein
LATSCKVPRRRDRARERTARWDVYRVELWDGQRSALPLSESYATMLPDKENFSKIFWERRPGFDTAKLAGRGRGFFCGAFLFLLPQKNQKIYRAPARLARRQIWQAGRTTPRIVRRARRGRPFPRRR